MHNFAADIHGDFVSLIEEIPHIGFKKYTAHLLERAQANLKETQKSIKELPPVSGKKAQSAIVISAGPSLHRRQSIKRILDSGYTGSIVCVDAAYTACLRAGLVPDYVVTLDPDSTRVVRWFGDPNFEENSKHDDYFTRQDLDPDFRKNSVEHNNHNIKLVNEKGHLSKAIAASCISDAVLSRLKQAKFDTFWWNPLIDDPQNAESETRKLFAVNRLPCLNTGGNVGTAAWVFAQRLNVPRLGLIGMDFGYYDDTPLYQTQTYYELINRNGGSRDGLEKFFVECTFPLNNEKFYTDPTYFWYRKNFVELAQLPTQAKTFNCTEGGTLFDDKIPCVSLDDFIQNKI